MADCFDHTAMRGRLLQRCLGLWGSYQIRQVHDDSMLHHEHLHQELKGLPELLYTLKLDFAHQIGVLFEEYLELANLELVILVDADRQLVGNLWRGAIIIIIQNLDEMLKFNHLLLVCFKVAGDLLANMGELIRITVDFPRKYLQIGMESELWVLVFDFSTLIFFDRLMMQVL